MAREIIPFDSKELEAKGEYRGFRPGSPGLPVLSTPITPKENFLRMVKGEGELWTPTTAEYKMFNPHEYPDNLARYIVADQAAYRPTEIFNKDAFGVEWEFVPTAGGAMVRPGAPFIKDIENWEKELTMPDPDSFDWTGMAERNKEFLSEPRAYRTTIFTGFFERLISFIDMAPALLALVDEDQQEAVLRLFDALADYYGELFKRFKKYFDVDFVWFHDDWGSQRAPLFSVDTAREMLVPALKRTIDACHEAGMFFELHCCGKDELLVPAMIEAGVDMWAGQPMNDFEMLYKQYGKDIILGVDLEPLPENPTDQQIRDNVEKFLDTYPENVFVGMSIYENADRYIALYEESRKRLAK